MNEFGQWLLEINVTSHYLERLLDKQGVSLLWKQKSPAESNGIVKQSIPLLPLKRCSGFPSHCHTSIHRKESPLLKAITQAMEADKNVFLATQKDETIEEPTNDELHKVGHFGNNSPAIEAA